MNNLREKLGLKSSGRVYDRDTLERNHPRPNGKPLKAKRQKEGHDAVIAKLAPVGTIVTITTMDDEEITARLRESDRFTISVDNPFEDADEHPILFVYKHAIKYFSLHVIGDRKE